MLKKNELDKVIRIWGPLTPTLTNESIELWGPLEMESVIEAYATIAKAPPTIKATTIKPPNTQA